MQYSSNYLATILGNNFTIPRYKAILDSLAFENEVKRDYALIQSWENSDTFFEGHTRFIISLNLYAQQGVGIEMWLTLLQTLYKIDSATFDSIHKGTPYYHAGIMSIINHNYVEGFQWLDYAFDQDLATGRIGASSTPAVWTLSFDSQPQGLIRPNDFGVTQGLRNQINLLLTKLHTFEPSFSINETILRNKINSAILTASCSRSVRSCWAVFLGNLLNKDRINRYLEIAPKNGEIQLLVHKTLVEMTLILETLLKKAPYASSSGVINSDTLGSLITKIIPSQFIGISTKSNILINSQIQQNYTLILTDIQNAEHAEEKLAVALTLAVKVRNHSHHLFNEEFCSEDVFNAIFLRLSYAIIKLIMQLF